MTEAAFREQPAPGASASRRSRSGSSSSATGPRSTACTCCGGPAPAGGDSDGATGSRAPCGTSIRARHRSSSDGHAADRPGAEHESKAFWAHSRRSRLARIPAFTSTWARRFPPFGVRDAGVLVRRVPLALRTPALPLYPLLPRGVRVAFSFAVALPPLLAAKLDFLVNNDVYCSARGLSCRDAVPLHRPPALDGAARGSAARCRPRPTRKPCTAREPSSRPSAAVGRADPARNGAARAPARALVATGGRCRRFSPSPIPDRARRNARSARRERPRDRPSRARRPPPRQARRLAQYHRFLASRRICTGPLL